MAKRYGATGAGMYYLAFSVLNIFVLFGKFGFDLATVRFVSENRNDYGILKDFFIKSYLFLIPLNLFLMVFMFVSSPFIAKGIFHNEELGLYLRIMSFAVIFISLRFINANFLRGMKYIAEYSFLQNVSVYLSVLIMLIICTACFRDTRSLFYAFVFGVGFTFSLSFFCF